MGTKSLIRGSETIPALFNDVMRPWSWHDWFDNGGIFNRTLTVPAANIIEDKNGFNVSLAVPGMKKDDFTIDVNGNMLTISCEVEEKKEERDANYTRKEYNYSSFARSFTLPDEVNREKIEAHYENGVLKVALPKKEEAKRLETSKHIAVK
ncbi:MAG: Hsp20/alpha crystallin family protein [Bacteroidetes bacterium]|nr:Hsp20/alpha crystallin family protein [Bacteroidota bacterium]